MQATDQTPATHLAHVATTPRADDLARLVHTLLQSAADERRTRLTDGLSELATRLNITPKDADTPLGNVLIALEKIQTESPTSNQTHLLSALLARSIAIAPPENAAAESHTAETLTWIAAHTPIDALPYLDAALGPRADNLWKHLTNLIQRIDNGETPHIGRAGALIAAAALRKSTSPIATIEADQLATLATDPILQTLLKKTDGSSANNPNRPDTTITIKGELVSSPRHPITFIALACTGILAILHITRFLGRWGLHYKTPAEINITGAGITLKTSTEMLGRTLRERNHHVPIEAILRATREVKFPRVSMYAGLFALAIGSYLGISLLVDGARAASPELLAVGALLVAIGVGLDFALVNLGARGPGQCRLIIVPRKGQSFAIGNVDIISTDNALRTLARRA